MNSSFSNGFSPSKITNAGNFALCPQKKNHSIINYVMEDFENLEFIMETCEIFKCQKNVNIPVQFSS